MATYSIFNFSTNTKIKIIIDYKEKNLEKCQIIKLSKFLNISLNWKMVLTNCLFQRINHLASHQSVPYHDGTKMTQNLIKSRKPIFESPRQTKKKQYLASKKFAANTPLLLFVIITHFRAACQFLRDSNGPILRSWIFSRISLYIFEKNNHILWIFKNVIKIVFFNQFWNFWCPYRLIRPRQTRFCQQKSLFWNFTKF